MPKRIGIVTREDLVNAPLPQATKTYTVISHNFIINTVMKNLEKKGFTVSSEVYKCTDGAQIATGMFKLTYGDDPDLGMMFAFTNSYNKTLRFRCAIGGFARTSGGSIIAADTNLWGKVHKGKADEETAATIEKQIDGAEKYFSDLKADKDLMKNIELTKRQFAELTGVLYTDMKIISGEQLRIIRDEYDKPTYQYTTSSNSLWTLYNHIIIALAKAHPRNWMEQQKLVHYHLMSEYNKSMFDAEVKEPAVDPAQTNLEEQIEVVEKAGVSNVEELPEIPTQEQITADEFPEEEPEQLTQEDLEEEEPHVSYAVPVTEVVEKEVEKVVNAEHIKSATNEVTQLPKEEELPDSVTEVVKPKMTVKDGVDLYGHLLTKEEVAQLKKPTEHPEAVAKLKALAVKYDMKAPEELADEIIEQAVESGEIEKPSAEEMLKAEPVSKEAAAPIGFRLPGAPAEDDVMNASESTATEEVLDHFDNSIIDTPTEEAPVFDEAVIPEPVEELTPLAAEPVETTDSIDEGEFLMSISDVYEIKHDAVVDDVISIGDDYFLITKETADGFMLESTDVLEEVEEAIVAEPVTKVEEKPEIPDILPIEKAEEPTAIGEDFAIEDPEEIAEAKTMLKKSEEPELINNEEVDAVMAKMEDKPVRDAISKELIELYGSPQEFTYELKGDQYNVTLTTNEVIVLMKDLIDSIIE